MKIVSRSEWGARPPESVTLRKPSQLKGVVQHWFGIPKAAKNHKDCPALVKSVQRAHQAGEFNDIAYSHLVCLHGVVFEGRGFGVQTGANGNATVNREYAAVCAMIGKGDKPSGEMLVGLAEIINEWRTRGAGKAVKTHGSITGSECPGPDLTRWVNDKGYEKHLPKPKPAEERYDVDGPKGGAILRNVTGKTLRASLTGYIRRFGQVTVRKRRGPR